MGKSNNSLANALSKLNQCLLSISGIVSDLPEEAKACVEPVISFRHLTRHIEKRITFFGAFKAGKSTLLNAMIGIKLLPSRVNRATGVMTKISYAPQASAAVIYRASDGALREQTISIDEIANYILLDLSLPIAKAPAGIEVVSLQIPLDLLQNGLTLVDTPGLLDNEYLSGHTYQELQRSDLAVMVLSALKVLSLDEKEAAEKINDLLNGNLVFVVNRLDQAEEDEREEILEWAYDSLEGFGNSIVGAPKMFATEAKSSLEARKQSRVLVDGLFEFEQWLKTLFETPAGDQVSLLSRLGVLEHELGEANPQLQRQRLDIQKRLAALQKEAQRTLARQLKQFQQDIITSKVQLHEVKLELDQLGRQFVEDGIKEIDMLIMQVDSHKTEHQLTDCVDAALQSYSHRLNTKVNWAIGRTDLQPPSFALTRSEIAAEFFKAKDGTSKVRARGSDMINAVLDRGLIGSMINRTGGWINKKKWSEREKRRILLLVRNGISKWQPILKQKAKEHLNQVEKQLDHFSQFNQPKITYGPQYTATQKAERAYKDLIDRCNQLQEIINDIKAQLLA